MPKFSYSLNEQIYNEKKYYFYDTGLAAILSAKINIGSLAENAAANYLRDKGWDINYYYKDKMECDFILKSVGKLAEISYLPVEVKFKPQENKQDKFDWQQKGLKGFVKAGEELKASKGYIIGNQIEDAKKIGLINAEVVTLEKIFSGKII